MFKEKMIAGNRPCLHSLPVCAVLFLTSSFCAFSQQKEPVQSGASKDSLVAEQRLSYREREQRIDALVQEGIRLELKKDFDQAIDQYLAAKKIADDMFAATPMPAFKTKSDNCASKISNAYFYWARSIYEDALKSASETDYDRAIEKCRKAIEIYPPCKEKMEKIIERYSLMKRGAHDAQKLKESNPSAEELREKRVLLRQGQVFYETRQWDKARAKFEEVISLDPYNETAIDYIRKINYRMLDAGKLRFGPVRNSRNAQTVWEAVTPLISQDSHDSQSQEMNISKHDSSERIQTKLKEIVIDKISFEEVSIATAIRYLRQCSKEKDPEKIGVNFVLRGKINEPIKQDGSSSSSNAGQSSGSAENSDVEPLTMMLDNIPLETVINYICKQANLKYRIDDNAVVIASRDVPLDDVLTKVYPVEKSAIPLREGQSILDFLKESGINFEAGASAVYKDYIGRLIMTNTPKEHQNLEKFLLERSKIDPQVLIQTKFVEIQLNDLEELGFKYTFSRQNSNVQYLPDDSSKLVALDQGANTMPDYITNIYQYENPNSEDPQEKKWLVRNGSQPANVTYDSPGNEYYAKAPVQASTTTYTIGTDDMIRTFSTAQTLDSDTKDGRVEFSFSNNNGYKLNTKIFALDQADSADVLSCPRVTTMHDTTATIQLVTEKYFPSSWDEAEYTYMGNNIPVITGSVPQLDDETQLGISLEVTPFVDPDNDLIHVLMRPLIRTFNGWDDYSYDIPVNDTNIGNNNVNIPNTMLMPRITQRTVDTSATCSDNGTIVLGGMIRDEVGLVEDKYPVLGDLPLIGRFFQSKGRTSRKYNLLIFLSCRLVNPDGSPLRERENRGLPPFKY